VSGSGPDLVYLCDWLPPDFGAVGQYSLQFSRERAQRGQRVVLYGLSSTAGSREVEKYDGGSLSIVRLKAPVYDRADMRARALWTLRTNFSLVRSAFADMRGCREIIFTGSPPFMLHLLAPLNLYLRKTLTYRITDFFPESLMAEYRRVPLFLRLLYRLTLFWRRRVSRFEVLGEDQRARLLEVGTERERILLKRDPSPVAIPPGTEPLQRPEALRGYRILLYSGNFGAAHDYVTFLGGYQEHHRQGSHRVALWLNATGRYADALEKAFTSADLPYLRTRPVRLEQLARLLVTPDAHLITLLDQFSGYALPSKVHACIESRRPILYIGPRSSDVHLLCSTLLPTDGYSQVNVGDVAGVLQALERI
jgi:hypothetical protein